MDFFVFPTITGRSDAVDPIWVAPWESWRPGRFKNVELFEFFSFWTGVTAAQSQQSRKFSTRHRNYASLQKTNTFELGICMLRNSYQLMSTLLTWADKHFEAHRCLVQKLQFFVTKPSPEIFCWHLTRLWGPKTMVQIISTPMCHTYLESPGHALRHGGTLDGS